jgi:hypothetical protein
MKHTLWQWEKINTILHVDAGPKTWDGFFSTLPTLNVQQSWRWPFLKKKASPSRKKLSQWR